MAFSRSPYTIRSNHSLIDPILAAPPGQAEIKLYFTELEAPRKAQKIRECFFCARHNRKDFPRLAELADIMEVLVRGNAVIVRRTDYVEINSTKGGKPAVTIYAACSTSAQLIQFFLDNWTADMRLLVYRKVHLDEEAKQEVKTWIARNEGWTADWEGETLTIYLP
jgi:hypothetical protein